MPSRALLSECITLRMPKNHRCRPFAGKNYYANIKRLKRRFDKAARAAERKSIKTGMEVKRPDPPDIYFFKPDRKFIYDARRFLRWADTILAFASNENGRMAIYAYLRSELFRPKDYDAMMDATVFNPARLEKRLKTILETTRHIFPDEQKRHVQYVASLGQEYFLVRIITPHGMKIAAEKASNCLYSSARPDRDYPHRRRVLNQSRFGYYQVRDGNNNSVATIALDFDKARYAYEGNHEMDSSGQEQTFILPKQEFLIAEWEAYFATKYPDFNARKPYGTRPHFASIRHHNFD